MPALAPLAGSPLAGMFLLQPVASGGICVGGTATYQVMTPVPVYLLRMPHKTPQEGVILTLINQTHWRGMRWFMGNAMGVASARIQVDVVGKDSFAISKQLETLVNAFQGQWGQVQILSTSDLSNIDNDEFYGDGMSNMLRRRTIELTVLYRESRPVFSGARLTNTADIETSLVNYLSDLAPVYHSGFPQVGSTGILWRKTDSTPFYGLGQAFEFSGHEFTLTMRAKRQETCSTLANRVRCRLDGLVGQIDQTLAAQVYCDSESETYSSVAEGSDESFSYITAIYKMNVE